MNASHVPIPLGDDNVQWWDGANSSSVIKALRARRRAACAQIGAGSNVGRSLREDQLLVELIRQISATGQSATEGDLITALNTWIESTWQPDNELHDSREPERQDSARALAGRLTVPLATDIPESGRNALAEHMAEIIGVNADSAGTKAARRVRDTLTAVRFPSGFPEVPTEVPDIMLDLVDLISQTQHGSQRAGAALVRAYLDVRSVDGLKLGGDAHEYPKLVNALALHLGDLGPKDYPHIRTWLREDLDRMAVDDSSDFVDTAVARFALVSPKIRRDPRWRSDFQMCLDTADLRAGFAELTSRQNLIRLRRRERQLAGELRRPGWWSYSHGRDQGPSRAA